MQSKTLVSDDIVAELIAGLGQHSEKEKPKNLTLLVPKESKEKFEELQLKTKKEFHKKLAKAVAKLIDEVHAKVG